MNHLQNNQEHQTTKGNITDLPYVSVIIPAKNEEMYISECLHAVNHLNYPNDKYEVIVIDNGSTDNTTNIIKQHDVKLFSKTGGTISSTRNYGVKQSKGEIIAFLDADSVPPTNWLIEGLKIMESDDVSAVGFCLAVPKNNTTWVERTWFLLNSSAKSKGTNAVSWLSSFNLMVKLKDFEMIKGFNESLVTCEDADFGFRLTQKSTMILSDKVTIKHLDTTKTIMQLFIKELWRGRGNIIAYMNSPKKTENLSTFVPLLFVVTILFCIIRVVKSGPYAFSIFTFIIISVPALMIMLKAQYISIKNICSLWLISFIYLIARGIAAFGVMRKID